MASYLEPPSRYDNISQISRILTVNSTTISGTNPNLFGNNTLIYNIADNSIYVYDGTTWNIISSGPPAVSQIGVVNTSTTIVGNTNPNLFPPFNAVYNIDDRNTYIFDGTSWQIISSQPESIQAVPLTVALTPNTIGVAKPLVESRGSNLSVLTINGVPAVPNVRQPVITSPSILPTPYTILHTNGTIVFNPGEYYNSMTPGLASSVLIPYSITNLAGDVSSSFINFVITRPALLEPRFDSELNSILKFDITTGSDIKRVTKNISGTDLQLSPYYQLGGAADLDQEMAIVEDQGAPYFMQRVNIAASLNSDVTLNRIEASSTISRNDFVYKPHDELLIGAVSSLSEGRIRVGACNQDDHIAFFVNETPASNRYAAVITLPGYKSQTIPTITEPGVVIRVRDNPANTIPTIIGRINRCMAWSPLSKKYYSFALTGLPLTGVAPNVVGTTIGAANSLKLVESTLTYSTYDPAGATPYVGYTATVYDLTISGTLPVAPNFAQSVESVFIDSTNTLYAFADQAGTRTGNSYIFSINLNFLPNITNTNASIVVINPLSPVKPYGTSVANAYYTSAMAAPDLSLSATGLPITSNPRNSYLTTPANTPIAIAVPTVLARIIKPLPVSAVAPIKRLVVEFIKFSTNTTITHASPPSPIIIDNAPPSPANTAKNTVSFSGASSIANYTTLLNSITYVSDFVTGFEHRVDVWVEAVNGTRSPIQTAFILVV